MRFSLMVSVYNAETFLETLLNSILAQTMDDFEVLLIDDGSTDHSDKLCDSFAERDKRFRVFHTENRGVFVARQYAEQHAKGDYLLHLDADDIVEPEMLSALSSVIDAHNPDLLIFDFSTFRPHEEPIRESFWECDQLLHEDNFRELYHHLFSTRCNTLCNKCFHRSLIAHAPDYKRFNGIRHGEDLLRSAHLAFGAQKVYYLHKSFYNYRLGVGSTGHFDPESLTFSDMVQKDLQKLLRQKNLTGEEWQGAVNDLCRKQLENYIRLLAGSKISLKEATALLRKAASLELFQRAMQSNASNLRMTLLRRKRYRLLILLQRGKRWLHA